MIADSWASLRNRVTVVLYRRRIHARVSRSVSDAWPLIVRVFSRSNAVYSGPVGASGSRPFQSQLIDLLVSRADESEDLFVSHLTSGDAMVVAYCLIGLERLHSERIERLPSEVFARTKPIVLRVGCFGRRVTLGQLAHEIVSRGACPGPGT